MEIKDRFSEFTRAGYFSRINATMIADLYIGLDEKNNKSIELRGKFSPKKITGTTAIDVNQYKKQEYNTIRFSLLDEDVVGLFYKFCDDLIEQLIIIKEINESYSIITNRYFQWKKLFVNSHHNFLSEPEIMGLIGEICFLKGNLAERIGLSNALGSWSGQELTHKDFSYNGQWFEVKTISRGHQSVRISSLEQLESNNNGELVVYSLERLSENYAGITLNNLFIETSRLFDNAEERDKFLAKVYMQGYEFHSYYDQYVYEMCDFIRYNVNNDFPKLTRELLPSAIRKASYEIGLADIADFIIKE